MDDDEEVKAAILLAHTPPDVPMPKELERLIARQAVGAARHTTTRGAAVSTLPIARRTRRPSARELAPWLVAAACLAFATFEWRSAVLIRAERAQAASIATPPASVKLQDHAGHTQAIVEWSPAQRTGILRLDELPRGSPGPCTREAWALSSDGAPVLLGRRTYGDDRPASEVWNLTASLPLREPADMWVTEHASGGTLDDRAPRLLLSTRWPHDEH